MHASARLDGRILFTTHSRSPCSSSTLTSVSLRRSPGGEHAWRACLFHLPMSRRSTNQLQARGACYMLNARELCF